MVWPGASRPITVRARIEGRVLGSSTGTTGSQNCEPTSWLKPAGITPITVYWVSESFTTLPTSAGSEPNCWLQRS